MELGMSSPSFGEGVRKARLRGNVTLLHLACSTTNWPAVNFVVNQMKWWEQCRVITDEVGEKRPKAQRDSRDARDGPIPGKPMCPGRTSLICLSEVSIYASNRNQLMYYKMLRDVTRLMPPSFIAVSYTHLTLPTKRIV